MFDNFFPDVWSIITTKWEQILKGLGITLLIAITAIIIGIIIGTIVASVKLMPKKKNNYLARGLEKVLDIYVGFFRGTPVVVQLLLMYFVIFASGEPLIIAIIVFGLNSGAYVSEIMRGAILSVDKGQMEASRSLGFNYSQSMTYTILPQAMKNAIPSVGNEFITLFKETSVVSFISVVDLTQAFKFIVSAEYKFAASYVMLALVYLVFVILFSYLFRLIERRLRRSDLRK